MCCENDPLRTNATKPIPELQKNYCLSSLIRNIFVQHAYRLARPATLTGGTEDEVPPKERGAFFFWIALFFGVALFGHLNRP